MVLRVIREKKIGKVTSSPLILEVFPSRRSRGTECKVRADSDETASDEISYYVNCDIMCNMHARKVYVSPFEIQ